MRVLREKLPELTNRRIVGDITREAVKSLHDVIEKAQTSFKMDDTTEDGLVEVSDLIDNLTQRMNTLAAVNKDGTRAFNMRTTRSGLGINGI